MSKRFTDTTKWTQNKWFRKLVKDLKLLWVYILDTCDNIGVYEHDIELFNMLTGCEVTEEQALTEFDDRIKVIENGRKWWVVDFCIFQYGKLSDKSANIPHKAYINALKLNNLWQDYLKQSEIYNDDSESYTRKRITQNKKDDIYFRDRFVCMYCNNHFDDNLLTVDHVIPIAKGGTNDDSNLVTCCVTCNTVKNDLSLAEFIKKQKLNESDVLCRVSKILDTLQEKETDKEQIQDKEKNKDKEKQLKQRQKVWFDEIWSQYPNKDGKKQAERHFFASVLTQADYDDIKTALTKYRAHLRKETWKQPKSASTWFNNWQDWVEWQEPSAIDLQSESTLTAEQVKKKQADYEAMIEKLRQKSLEQYKEKRK